MPITQPFEHSWSINLKGQLGLKKISNGFLGPWIIENLETFELVWFLWGLNFFQSFSIFEVYFFWYISRCTFRIVLNGIKLIVPCYVMFKIQEKKTQNCNFSVSLFRPLLRPGKPFLKQLNCNALITLTLENVRHLPYFATDWEVLKHWINLKWHPWGKSFC